MIVAEVAPLIFAKAPEILSLPLASDIAFTMNLGSGMKGRECFSKAVATSRSNCHFHEGHAPAHSIIAKGL